MKKNHLLALLICLLPLLALSQPFTLDKNIKPLRLDLQPVKNHKGSKGISLQGTTIAEGHYFFVKGHGMLQPIDVILEAPDDRNLKLEVFYGAWNEPDRSTATGSAGLCKEQFMVYGEFGIRVSGEKTGVPYLLTVYASPEALPELDSPFVPVADTGEGRQDAPTAGTDGGGNSLLYVAIIALLGVIVGLLAVLLFRKNKQGPAAMILLLYLTSLPQSANTQGANPGGYGNENIRTQEGVFERPPAPESWQGMTTEQADRVWSGGVKMIEYLKGIQKGVSAWEAYQSLGSCMRITSPPNTPEVPSFCTEPVLVYEGEGAMEYVMRPNQACTECFTESRVQFNRARLELEKLRVIYNCTKKMSDAAIAAGDNMSGIHGYSGIIWQGMRQEIMVSIDKLEKAYDAKYPQLINKLHDALIEMSICEAQFGLEDWYDRFGFVYYEFMKDSYKRKD